jgi:hypothetical protein
VEDRHEVQVSAADPEQMTIQHVRYVISAAPLRRICCVDRNLELYRNLSATPKNSVDDQLAMSNSETASTSTSFRYPRPTNSATNSLVTTGSRTHQTIPIFDRPQETRPLVYIVQWTSSIVILILSSQRDLTISRWLTLA